MGEVRACMIQSLLTNPDVSLWRAFHVHTEATVKLLVVLCYVTVFLRSTTLWPRCQSPFPSVLCKLKESMAEVLCDIHLQRLGNHLNLRAPTVEKGYSYGQFDFPMTCLLRGAQLLKGYFFSSSVTWVGVHDWSWLMVTGFRCMYMCASPSPKLITVTEKQNEWHLQLCFPCGDSIDHNWHLLKHSLAETYLPILPPSENANKYARGSRRWGRNIIKSSIHSPYNHATLLIS